MQVIFLLEHYCLKTNNIAFISRALTDTEQNYSINEKELLAIVSSLQKWPSVSNLFNIGKESEYKIKKVEKFN